MPKIYQLGDSQQKLENGVWFLWLEQSANLAL